MALMLIMLLLGILAAASLAAVVRPFWPFASRRQAALGASLFVVVLLLTPVAYILAHPFDPTASVAPTAVEAAIEPTTGPGTVGWQPTTSPAPSVSNLQSVKVPISDAFERSALASCERYAKAAAAHPSTVSFSIWGSDIELQTDGAAIVTSTFTARNSFNLETRHDIRCSVTPAGEVSAQIAESR